MPVTTITMDTTNDVTFNDGEGLTSGDLNGVQQESKRWLLEDFYRIRMLDSEPLGFRTFSNGLACSANGGADMKVVIFPGICIHKLATVARPDYSTLLFNFSQLQVFTVDAAAAFIRWDIITAKVEKIAKAGISRDFKDAVTGALSTVTTSKSRLYRLSLTYTPGTVASTEPAVPAGEVKIARIEVPISATVINNTMLRDFREPMGRSTQDIPLSSMHADQWSLDPLLHKWGTLGGGGLYIPLTSPRQGTPVQNPGPLFVIGRVVRITIEYNFTVGAIVARTLRFAGGVETGIETLTSQLAQDGTWRINQLTPTEPLWLDGNQNAVATNGGHLYLHLAAVGVADVRGCWLEVHGL